MDIGEMDFSGMPPRWCYVKMGKITRLNQIYLEPFSSPRDFYGSASADIDVHISENFEYFNSTKVVAEKLMQALKDEGRNIIGFHGEKGSGKTALVTAEEVKYKKNFYKVLFLTVPPSILHIMPVLRNQIISQLYLRFEENTSNLDRLIKIKSTLENQERVLVIFDNGPAMYMFDPRDIGIPPPGEQCKFLWISRDKETLTMRGCLRRHLIHMSPLSKGDAWQLLKQYAGIDDDDDDSSQDDQLINVARQVSALCKGLPGLIQDVVSSLVKKDSKEYWTELLDSLKHSDACHQIFISFRGSDTRDTFTYLLNHNLVEAGFKVFKDDEKLRGGDEISVALIEAIEKSRFFIVVLSENFAESSWCLSELVHILRCRKDIKQRVLPVFYKVAPSDIRNLKGCFGQGMVKRQERSGEQKTREWISALKEIAGLSGKHYISGPEYEFIQSIVEYAKNNKHCLYII